MSKENFNLGASANDGTGDKLRTAFFKVSNNFTELYSTVNVAYNTANAAFSYANNIDTINTATLMASTNAAFIVANAAFDYANTIVIESVNLGPAFDVANAAFVAANNVFVSVPVTSKGQVGDTLGMLSTDGSYFYCCTTDYVDGNDDIWKRMGWSLETW